MFKWMPRIAVCFAALVLAMNVAGCFKAVDRKTMSPEEPRQLQDAEIDKKRTRSPFLKAHMHNGDVYVLESWQVNEDRTRVSGVGKHYDPNRTAVEEGALTIDVSDVALFETNRIHTSGPAAAITLFTGVTVTIAVICLSEPKACFGSCPTFYFDDEPAKQPRAEGFSSSIAPSLEASDIDDLNRTVRGDEPVTIVMKNEALETHVVRHVDLLAVPLKDGVVVLAGDDGGFFEASAIEAPSVATGPEGDILTLVAQRDGAERMSESDSTFLGAREVIDLSFDSIPREGAGLAISCRQTLLSTYLLYQAFAYMGEDVAYWLAQIERGAFPYRGGGVNELMGGIEVLARNEDGSWRFIGELDEHGPLATDRHMISLDGIAEGTTRLRLRMSKGHWRIDSVALATGLRAATPERIRPRRVTRESEEEPVALATLLDAERSLTTLPGDTYKLHYDMPANPGQYTLFLESRGYYLEWMRKEWAEEADPVKLVQMFADPVTTLEQLAPEFKKVESKMEAQFWGSRYVRP